LGQVSQVSGHATIATGKSFTELFCIAQAVFLCFLLALVLSQLHFLVNPFPFHSKKKEVLGCSEQASAGDDDGDSEGCDLGDDDGDSLGDDDGIGLGGDGGGDSLPDAT